MGFASAHRNGMVFLWDADLRNPPQTFTDLSRTANGVAWSPDGNMIAAASGDRTVAVWNVSMQEMLIRLGGHTDEVRDVAWSTAGTLLVSASWDGTIILWDAAMLTGRD
jgi:WD40 repeat protein